MRLTLLSALALVLFAPAVMAEGAAPAAKPDAGAQAERELSALEVIEKEIDQVLEFLNLDFYGHFKLDMSRDSTETNFGNTAFFVRDYESGERDEELNITASHTRFGLNWKGGEYEGIKATGKIEIDFLGKAEQKNSETRELQAAVRLRHAWMKFDFGEGWSMLAGQTWDVFAPLNARTLNTMVGWGQGNLGYRRPMLMFAKVADIGEKSDLTFKFAVARPVARDSGKLDDDDQDDGEDSGVPDLQGHLGAKFPSPFCKKAAKLGFGGFYGWREVDGDGVNLMDEEHYRSWALALDFLVPILDNLDILGEVWFGEALDGYRGGVWQSYVVVDKKDVETISANGWFINVVWKPVKKWRVSVGYGSDNPDNGDFHGKNGRLRNTTFWGNVTFSFYPNATVGLEYMRMDTDWRTNHDRVNHRIQVAFMLKF